MSDGIPPILGGDQQWRRLDARMLLVHPVQEAVRFFPALLVVFFSGRSSGRSGWWEWALLAGVIVLGMSRWFTTRYRIWGGQIELRRGLLNRRLLTTPADRVRTVDVTAPVWHRLLGLAKVEIGTAGGGVLAERIVLDALAAPVAARLRGELLHRVAAQAEQDDEDGSVGGSASESSIDSASESASASASESTPEQLLVQLDPSWVRYAPLTTSGLVSAAAIWGFGAQYLDEFGDLQDRVEGAVDRVATLGVGVAVVAGLVGALVLVSLLAVTGYLLTYWGFRLTRHTGGTLHTRRGLLTTRATSLEEKRIRGVEIGQPLGLRLAAAGRLSAVTTGLGREGAQHGSAWLTPPAPRSVIEATAVAVVDDPDAVSGPLVCHGPAARRRFTRALVPTAVLCAATVWLSRVVDLPPVLMLVGCVPVLLAPFLAADRYAALGHALTPRHLVVQAGSLSRRRDLLARDGVIGVTIRESFFQRRAGVVTLTATTAAGRQRYAAIDLPVERANAVATVVLGDIVGQFADSPGRADPSAGRASR